jgi:serine/threonine protein phosphatase PrpC
MDACILRRHANPSGITVGACEMQGRRDTMEDEMTITDNVFGVFDGHCGEFASRFVAGQFQEQCKTSSTFFDEDKAIENKFLEIDQSMRVHPDHDGSGSTACVVKLEKDKLLAGKYNASVANLGDSRCLVIDRLGELKFVTSDHKPEEPHERARIEAAKGWIYTHGTNYWGGGKQISRLDGNLSVSRSFADFAYKSDPERQPHEQKMSIVPTITRMLLDEGDALLICCDGITEKLETDEIVQFLKPALLDATMNCDPASIARSLVKHCLAKGSNDNMSAMLVLCKSPADLNVDPALPSCEYDAHTDIDEEMDLEYNHLRAEQFLAFAQRAAVDLSNEPWNQRRLKRKQQQLEEQERLRVRADKIRADNIARFHLDAGLEKARILADLASVTAKSIKRSRSVDECLEEENHNESSIAVRTSDVGDDSEFESVEERPMKKSRYQSLSPPLSPCSTDSETVDDLNPFAHNQF